MVIKKECETCGVEFETENKRQRFCCRKCKDSFKKEKTCEVCGKKFMGIKTKKCCSVECSLRLAAINRNKTCEEKYGGINPAKLKENIEKQRKTMEERYGGRYTGTDEYASKRKKTCLEKYGAEHYSKTQEYKDRVKQTSLEKYGVEAYSQTDECKEKVKQTSLDRYGASHFMKTDEGKERLKESVYSKYGVTSYTQTDEYKEKTMATNLEKYGCEYLSQNDAIKEKIRITSLQKYGETNYAKTKECKDKVKQTCLNKYGAESVMFIDEFKDKIKSTCLKKYGETNYLKTDECKNKSRNTCMAKYGVPYHCMTPECRNSSSSNSKENKKFRNFLKDNGIQNVIDDKELSLLGYSYDIPLGDTLIEISPRAFHNLTFNPKVKEIGEKSKRLEELQRKNRDETITDEEKKEKKELLLWRKIKENYHKDKTIVARENGYRCINVFSWDDWSKILYLLEDNKERIYARKCEACQITYEEAHELFEAYHLQGDTQKNKDNIYIGLKYEGTLVMAISYGMPRYNKEYQWEILRLCSHKDYSVIGGAGKIHKYFLELTNAESVISYCDMGKFDGKVYEQLGFTLLQRNSPSRHRWFRGMTNPEKQKLEEELGYKITLPTENKRHFTDNQINLARGFDQLLGKHFGKFGKGTRNDELLRKFNYVEIYDCGQATYIRKKEEN